ncbi:MAG: STAS/SEC14 domain-containing protein [Sphingomonas sp.]|uniref:STAS/SEC14 domain-containing protein n=1 Tax=Sphingomonas sp. TaxID=28214 RepID=UPI001B0B6BE2|nr:STAS/SEC14 domain-containing protein [Sphingomonas sp.]MBO9621407.1 STAS/SEC14 domain-containing protein [Sphingomonas sp.]
MPHSVSHHIEVDPVRKIVELRVSGLLSPEDAEWIGEELRAAIRSLGRDAGRHCTLYDGSGIKVVPAATVARISQTFDNPAVRELWARKVAFVVTTALARRQVMRLRQIRPDLGVFDTRETALAWLMEE